MSAVLLTGGMLTTTTSATADTPKAQPKVESCYGNAKEFTAYTRWPDDGYVHKTSACNDINIWSYGNVGVEVCFEKIGLCNDYHYPPRAQWSVIASNVRDGAGFYLHLLNPDPVLGKVAY
ncbi:hypothetical protein ACPCTO_37195 [Streptomyces olivoreticuli]